MRKELHLLFATRVSHCKHCGAVVEKNKFEHKKNCLSNIPGRYFECSPFWFRGRNHGDRPDQMTTEQEQSYEMGRLMGEDMRKATRPERPETKGFSNLFAQPRV